ncbi:hypothetical protein [Vibrio harveyi]|uniref:hypothetical protein n=1 Tax=Vibrio harveyi TaxID=669 RepID=UPI00068026D0|nr:hypothetical protein [Vibrio harveyi]EKO3802608.1 hypothetical protein [Vibrio harveyi]
MKQGSISDEEWNRLSDQEKVSLEEIRSYYAKRSDAFSPALEVVDKCYEAMGHRFRSRVNQSVREYGRYVGDRDGVFLIIHTAIRTYHSSDLFPETTGDALSKHKLFRSQRSKAIKYSSDAFGKLERVVDWISHTATTVCEEDELAKLRKELKDIEFSLERHFNRTDLTNRCPSRAESFVLSLCNHLVWEANIKPTKPITSSGEKSPLLRFIEVFFPIEGQAALSSIYEKQKRLPAENKIGGKFIPVNRG